MRLVLDARGYMPMDVFALSVYYTSSWRCTVTAVKQGCLDAESVMSGVSYTRIGQCVVDAGVQFALTIGPGGAS